MGYPGGSVVKHLPAMQEMWIGSLDWKDPLENGRAGGSMVKNLPTVQET